MTLARRPKLLPWLCLTMVALAMGCDSPIEPGDPQQIDINGNTAVAPNFTNHTITATRRGVATMTLSFAAGDLDFFVTATGCVNGPFAPEDICASRVFSQADGAVAEQLKMGMVEGETAKLWVQNFSGATGRPYTIQVIVAGTQ